MHSHRFHLPSAHRVAHRGTHRLGPHHLTLDFANHRGPHRESDRQPNFKPHRKSHVKSNHESIGKHDGSPNVTSDDASNSKHACKPDPGTDLEPDCHPDSNSHHHVVDHVADGFTDRLGPNRRITVSVANHFGADHPTLDLADHRGPDDVANHVADHFGPALPGWEIPFILIVVLCAVGAIVARRHFPRRTTNNREFDDDDDILLSLSPSNTIDMVSNPLRAQTTAAVPAEAGAYDTVDPSPVGLNADNSMASGVYAQPAMDDAATHHSSAISAIMYATPSFAHTTTAVRTESTVDADALNPASPV